MAYLPFLKLDSKKNIDFSAWGGFEGFLRDTSNGAGGWSTVNLLKRISPFLSRAIDMTAVSIANLPFHITKDTVEIDKSMEWKNKIGGMEKPKELIYKIASSLCGGKAYIIPQFTGRMIADLRYIAPHTVVPLITTAGLQWFSRASDFGNAGVYSPIVPMNATKSVVGEKEIDIALSNYNGDIEDGKLKAILNEQNAQDKFNGQMMYFWLPDSDIEIGPAKKYPIGTALISAQLLAGVDTSLKLLADRHFVPATLVSGKGMPSQQDREKTENWLNRFLKGAFESAFKIINAEAMTIEKVGGGMEDLKTVYGEVVKQGIENIGASFGIPAGIFTSDKAFAQEMDALIRLWYSASEFIAIYHCIEDTFNTQLLNQWGYKLTFMPETIDAFQDDEATRAIAFRDYASARIRPSVVAQILGMEMPPGMDFKVLDEDFDKPQIAVPVNPLNNPELPIGEGRDPALTAASRDQNAADNLKPSAKPVPPKSVSLDANELKEIVLWRQMATRWFKKGKGSAVDFETKFLSDEIANQIREKLGSAKTELDIVKAFDLEAPIPMPQDGLFALAAAVNKLADKA